MENSEVFSSLLALLLIVWIFNWIFAEDDGGRGGGGPRPGGPSGPSGGNRGSGGGMPSPGSFGSGGSKPAAMDMSDLGGKPSFGGKDSGGRPEQKKPPSDPGELPGFLMYPLGIVGAIFRWVTKPRAKKAQSAPKAPNKAWVSNEAAERPRVGERPPPPRPTRPTVVKEEEE